MRRFVPTMLLLSFGLALSGCIAAAIPVVAGGAVARSAGHDRAKRTTAVLPPRAASAPAQAAAVNVAPPTPLPSDVAAMEAGQLYAGRLPPPGPKEAPLAPTSVASSPAPTSPRVASWADVGHHVAANLSPEHSLLLERGSDAADPRWVACAGKPPAVLVAAITVLASASAADHELDPAARSWLEAFRTLNVRTVVVAADPAEASAVETAFLKGGLTALVNGDTLIVASSPGQMPSIRAGVGARYCVVALAGRSAGAFPLGLTPATTPPALQSVWGAGWFLLPAS